MQQGLGLKMSSNLGSSSECRDHHWKQGNGVCHSCLTERLLSMTFASKPSQLGTEHTDSSDQKLAIEDSNTASNSLPEAIAVSATENASLSGKRSKFLEQGSLQRGRNSKEFLCDTEDDQRICLVYFDSDHMAESDLSCGQAKSFKVSDNRRKGGAALAGRRAHYCRSSSVRIDRGSKPGKKDKILRTSTIFRRLFASTKTTMDRCTNHQSEEIYDQRDPKARLVRASSVREEISSSNCKSSSLNKVSSVGGDGSDPRELQRSDFESLHPLRRVIPVTSTGCYDRITKPMKHESIHKYPYQSCSKKSINQLGRRTVWRKDIGSPLRIFTKKLSYNSHENHQCIDLDKHFQGATTSWSMGSTMVELERRQPHQSPAQNAFYKDQSQLSFRSSPLQTRKRRRRKAMQSRHGIIHLSPCSFGK